MSEMETPEAGETEMEGAEGGAGDIQGALDGIMASADAMKTVAEAFMQMGQEGPAQKLMQASELASSALHEMIGGQKQPKGKAPVAAQDAMAAGSGSKAIPVG